MKKYAKLLCGSLFATIGLLVVGFACLWIVRNAHFANFGTHAEGKVVENVSRRSQNSSGGAYSYYPIVEFMTDAGKSVRIQSTLGTNPALYSVGDSVKVLYDAKQPNRAKIDSDTEAWLPVGLAAFGSIFALIGLYVVFVEISSARHRHDARLHGTRVTATITGIEMDQSIDVGGQRPYLILAQWLNPATGQLHLFKSESIWFDPKPFIKGETISVFVEPHNPKSYYVDISILPKIAA